MAVNSIQVERKLFSVTQYEQMIAAGVLNEDDRLELIEGDILAMSPIGGLHIHVVNRLNRLFVQRLGDRAVVSVQNPVRLSNSEPQPDLAILRPEADERAAAVPGADDVLLLVEVADTTARFDQTVKVPLHGREGIAECWLIDLAAGVVEVYRGPGAGGYKTKETYAPGDVLSVAFHRWTQHTAIFGPLRTLLGETTLPHPRTIARPMLPARANAPPRRTKTISLSRPATTLSDGTCQSSRVAPRPISPP